MRKPRRLKRRKRRSRLWAWLLMILVILAAGYAGVHAFFKPPDQKPDGKPDVMQAQDGIPADNLTDEEAQALRSHYERKDSFYTILLSGTDGGGGNSDTNILVAVDAANGSIYGVSIPRDTKANINGKNYKINAAYALGGMELLSDVVAGQLGIPVDYTISVDLRGFRALVDAIDGVDFYIPINMNYDDPVQNLSIHFSKGMRHLTGAEALKVVRFRHNNDGSGYGSEDIGRMQTQQDFLKAVAKKILTPASLTKLDDFVKIFQQYVETDLSIGNLAWLGGQAVSIGPDNIEFSTLPGDWKSPYIYLNEAEVLEVVNQYLNPYVEDRLPEDMNLLS